ncbi:hypothetical protein FB45DRAFT_1009132 [Roridomyces roridus]|uniref:DUF6534 domain-containing protein n=1 Tax=Roridomyces roridus TaxID=1738132 RepID=A0AAD7B7Y3_9AGAR|nr:hypothetical protein FB45DRAFT_1009132 [Roridomyces roridus]
MAGAGLLCLRPHVDRSFYPRQVCHAFGLAAVLICTHPKIAAAFSKYRKFIIYLTVVATANIIVQCGIIYQPLILQYGSLFEFVFVFVCGADGHGVTIVGEVESFIFAPTLLPGDSFIISIVSAPIQLFAGWRLLVITEFKNFFIPALIGALSLTAFGLGMFFSALVVMNRKFQEFDKFTTVATLWLVLGASCDVVIALAMSYTLLTRKWSALRANRRSHSSSRVDAHIDRIVRLAVGTCSLTALTAVADVVLFRVIPGTMVFIVAFPLANLHICSMLAMLNCRGVGSGSDTENPGSASASRDLESQSSDSMCQSKILRAVSVSALEYERGESQMAVLPRVVYLREGAQEGSQAPLDDNNNIIPLRFEVGIRVPREGV